MPQDEIIDPDASQRPYVSTEASIDRAIRHVKKRESQRGRSPANRDLPEATSWSMPPVADTMYLSAETVVKPDFLPDQKLIENALEYGGYELGNWKIKPTRGIKSFWGCTHYLHGQGDMAGIKVGIAPATQVTSIRDRRTIRVHIESVACWRATCDGCNAVGIATTWLDRLIQESVVSYIPPREQVDVSRLDLCIDHTGYTWTMDDFKRFACRASTKRPICDPDDDEYPHGDRDAIVSRKGTTLYLGARGTASRGLRIYDKSKQAAEKGILPWLEPIWLQAGWDGVSTVWRAEIEHGGQWLKQHGFDSMAKLVGCERNLWENYATNVRHTSGNQTRLKNRANSDIWNHLLASSRTLPQGTWEWQPREPTAGKDVNRLIKQAAGCLAAAENALGTIPWEKLASTKDDRRSELLRLVIECMPA